MNMNQHPPPRWSITPPTSTGMTGASINGVRHPTTTSNLPPSPPPPMHNRVQLHGGHIYNQQAHMQHTATNPSFSHQPRRAQPNIHPVNPPGTIATSQIINMQAPSQQRHSPPTKGKATSTNTFRFCTNYRALGQLVAFLRHNWSSYWLRYAAPC